MNSKLAIAVYKPKEGKEKEMMSILKDHLPLLKRLNLISDKTGFLARSSDGSFIEIFEWRGEEEKIIAHSHPELKPVWDKMTEICDFPSLSELPEAGHNFPNFEVLD
jgi:hypothetical protein